ncbi:MAG: Nif3-like dinuclear metal center hexameric protein, partial [Gammaproteobacteria bacterium]|nr:Nif3-like dinuclear metal center hexameric protein [Gammaproteobacteria bacterium]
MLVDYCDQLLEADRFHDYCPNGLQVEGRGDVTRLVSGVTASQALIDAACEQRADLLLVHHGYFWKGEDPTITGIKRRRVNALLEAGVGLLAYHLPL